jgi:hypothetical protein
MELTDEQKGLIQEAMRDVECSKGFACCQSGLVRPDSIRDNRANGFLECLAESPQDCQFSLPFQNPSACLCPVRIYLVREFVK